MSDDEIDDDEEEVGFSRAFVLWRFFFGAWDICRPAKPCEAVYSHAGHLAPLQVEPSPPPRPVAIPTLQPDPSIRCLCGSQLDNQVSPRSRRCALVALAATTVVCQRAFLAPGHAGGFFFFFLCVSVRWFLGWLDPFDTACVQGMMICCDTCELWSHAVCYNVSPVAVPDHFFCNHCNPKAGEYLSLSPLARCLVACSLPRPSRAAAAPAPSLPPAPVPVAHAASSAPAAPATAAARDDDARGQKREREDGTGKDVVDAASLMTTFGGD